VVTEALEMHQNIVSGSSSYLSTSRGGNHTSSGAGKEKRKKSVNLKKKKPVTHEIIVPITSGVRCSVHSAERKKETECNI
jgi:hypothetical protein